jgi:hypothetical protein
MKTNAILCLFVMTGTHVAFCSARQPNDEAARPALAALQSA